MIKYYFIVEDEGVTFRIKLTKEVGEKIEKDLLKENKKISMLIQEKNNKII